MNNLKAICCAIFLGSLLLAACSTPGSEVRKEASFVATQDGALGKQQVRTYRGVLPPDSVAEIHYMLTLENREFSGDGTFTLHRRSVACGGAEQVDVCRGRRFTLRGTSEDDNATVWQFVADRTGEVINFLRVNERTLIPLDAEFHSIPSATPACLRGPEESSIQQIHSKI